MYDTLISDETPQNNFLSARQLNEAMRWHQRLKLTQFDGKLGKEFYLNINVSVRWYNSPLIAACFTQDNFSACKAEEEDIAVATLTDDNAADGNLDR